MALTGRPPLTEDVLRQRIADYCNRYGVLALGDDDLPPYPAGKRESRQHRDWVNLRKAWSRLRRRTLLFHDADRVAALQAQDGRCPICTRAVEAADVVDHDQRSGRVLGILHADCHRLVQLARSAGAGATERLQAYLAGTDAASRR
jgi:hypothetical protein